MRRALGPAFSIVVASCCIACEAPTKHSGNRPDATRREADLGPGKSMGERAVERDERRAGTSQDTGRDVAAAEQLVGVGSTHVYHRRACELLGATPQADRVLFVSGFDALDGGYDPCPTCRPGP